METTDDVLAPIAVVQWAQEFGEVGGVLTSHTQLTALLRRAGHPVVYVDTGSPIRAVRALPRALRSRSLHLFHITRVWRAVVMAPLFAVLPGRTVLVLHSGSVSRQVAAMGIMAAWLFRRSLDAYDEIWAVNDQIRSGMPGRLDSRLRVVTPFSNESTAPADAWSLREPHLVSVATNAGLAHYNADLAVAAVRLVRREWPDARLRILAYGADGEELTRLRAAISGLRWVEMTFDASPAEVDEVLRRSVVFLRPTTWDGDSVIVREALAAGARVVASECAPRPRGVELADLDAQAFAAAVLRGGRVSDGEGLAALSMFSATMAAVLQLR